MYDLKSNYCLLESEVKRKNTAEIDAMNGRIHKIHKEFLGRETGKNYFYF